MEDKPRLPLNRHPSTAPRMPEFLQRSTIWSRISAFSSQNLNFYRLHLLAFIVLPLIASGIFYASNGPSPENQIAYIDALFMVVSAMTVAGLNTVLFASITVWQQVIIFFMFTIGSTSFVSIIVIVVRRQFFHNKIEYMVEHDESARARVNEVGEQEAARAGRAYQAFDGSHRPGHAPWFTGLLPPGDGGRATPLTPRPSPAESARATQVDVDRPGGIGRTADRSQKNKKLTANMIKRVDVPVRVNEMSVSGRLGEGRGRDRTGEGDGASTLPQPSPAQGTEGGPMRGRPLPQDNDEVVRGVAARLERVAGEQDEGARRQVSPETLPDVSTDEEDAEGEEQAQREEEEEEKAARHRGETAGSPEVTTPRVDNRQAAVHPRAIQIDEPAKPTRTVRGRRSSDSAASPHHASGGAFPRTRTLDQLRQHGIAETTTQTPTSRTSRILDLEMGNPRTIELQEADDRTDLRMRRNRTVAIDPDFPVPRRMSQSNLRDGNARTFTRAATLDQTAMHTGFGGFPNPLLAVAGLAREQIPAVRNVFERHLTMPRTTTMLSTHSRGDSSTMRVVQHVKTSAAKPVSYISFDAIVGRNSKFHGLTDAQQEELGGVEYRALTILLRIVVSYWLFVQLIAVLVLAPWLSTSRQWHDTIVDEYKVSSTTWFAFFQVWSAFGNNGFSLVDASMVPFQRAYWLAIVQGFLILGGNTAYPIFLRLVIWTLSKVVPRQSQTRETLQFLLDHPRRCFIYLFPSHQTWFLVFVLLCLNGIDWVCFLVLDIGNPVIEAIPVGVRVFDGLFQAVSVRTAGFAIVPLASLAPAVQLLYVIMMYIAVYPIAVSIRATNVYEEKSMGVYDDDFDEDPDDVEARFEKSHSATQYIGYHARKQLAFDLWWLGLAVWLICIVERHRIGSTDWPEVTIFTLIFEIVSAYGTVGLSLGNNRTNTSLVGVLSTVSKLIIIAVMIRGRHRGLPNAIDRAVLLPSDFAKYGDDTTTVASADPDLSGPADFALRSRRTRSSSGSHQGPAEGGGLDAVEAMTDAARLQRDRRVSAMNGSGEEAFDGTGRTKLVNPPTEKGRWTGAGATDGSESVANRTASHAHTSTTADETRFSVPTDRNAEGWR